MITEMLNTNKERVRESLHDKLNMEESAKNGH